MGSQVSCNDKCEEECVPECCFTGQSQPPAQFHVEKFEQDRSLAGVNPLPNNDYLPAESELIDEGGMEHLPDPHVGRAPSRGRERHKWRPQPLQTDGRRDTGTSDRSGSAPLSPQSGSIASPLGSSRGTPRRRTPRSGNSSHRSSPKSIAAIVAREGTGDGWRQGVTMDEDILAGDGPLHSSRKHVPLEARPNSPVFPDLPASLSAAHLSLHNIRTAEESGVVCESWPDPPNHDYRSGRPLSEPHGDTSPTSPGPRAGRQKWRPRPIVIGRRWDTGDTYCSGSTPGSSRKSPHDSPQRTPRSTRSGSSSRMSSPKGNAALLAREGWRHDTMMEEDHLSPSRSSRKKVSWGSPSEEHRHGPGTWNLGARNPASNRGITIKDDADLPAPPVLRDPEDAVSAAHFILQNRRVQEAVAEAAEAAYERGLKPPDIRWMSSDNPARVKFSEEDRSAFAFGAPVRVLSNYVLTDDDVDVDIHVDQEPCGGANSVGVALPRSSKAKGDDIGMHMGRCKGSFGLLLFPGSMCDIEANGDKVQPSVCPAVTTGSLVTMSWIGRTRTLQFLVNHTLVGTPLDVPNGAYVFGISLKAMTAMTIKKVTLVRRGEAAG